jgi:hypothetical protein
MWSYVYLWGGVVMYFELGRLVVEFDVPSFFLLCLTVVSVVFLCCAYRKV